MLLVTGGTALACAVSLVVLSLACAAVFVHGTFRAIRERGVGRIDSRETTVTSQPEVRQWTNVSDFSGALSVKELLGRVGSSLRVAVPLLLSMVVCIAAATTPTALERAAEALFAASFGVASSIILLSTAVAAAAAALGWTLATMEAALFRRPAPRMPPAAAAPAPFHTHQQSVAGVGRNTSDQRQATNQPEAPEPASPTGRTQFDALRAKAQAEVHPIQ